MGQMEGDREDYAHPLLFGFRVSARPLDGLEVSLERTAQWCGEGRSCDWNDFWNLWSGHDNAGENVSAEDAGTSSPAGISAGHRRSATGRMPCITSIPAKASTTRFRDRITAWTSSASRRGVQTGRTAARRAGLSGRTQVRGTQNGRNSGIVPTTTRSSTRTAIAIAIDRSVTRWMVTARCIRSVT